MIDNSWKVETSEMGGERISNNLTNQDAYKAKIKVEMREQVSLMMSLLS